MKLLDRLKKWKDKTFGKKLDNGNNKTFTTNKNSSKFNKRVKQKNGSEIVINRVGRNEPCLCGSGIKFKYCKCSKNIK